VYGALQPFVYETQIYGEPELEQLKPIITMLIAALKMVWAISTVAILATRPVRDAEPLVVPVTPRPVTLRRFLTDTLMGRPSRNSIRAGVKAHTVSVFLVYICCSVLLCCLYAKGLERLAIALGVVTGLLELVRRAWEIIGIFDKYPAQPG
jgi:hypothetical protein